MLALDALKDLQRKFAERLNDTFPDEDVVSECENSIKRIRNIYTTKVQDIDFSNTSLVEHLPKLLAKYIDTGVNEFTVSGIELFSAWFYHSIFCSVIVSKETEEKDGLYQIRNITVLRKIFILFTNSKLNKRIVCENLLFGYLQAYDRCSQQFVSCLSDLITEIGKIENLFCYFDKNAFEECFSDEKMDSYNAFMALYKIRKIFYETKYFQDLWFDWALKGADVLSKKFLAKDFLDKINRVDGDEKKVLLAYIACKVDSSFSDNDSEKDSYFRDYLLPAIGKSNPLHEEYWNVDKYYKSNFGEFLEIAPKIFRKYYISEFILIFFDAYESTGGDDARAGFWRLYKNRINDFALGLADKDLHRIKMYIRDNIVNDLVENYLSILKEFTLRLYAPRTNTPAVLVLAFEEIIIVEFSEIGNAVYVYENTPYSRKKYLKDDNKINEDDFKNKGSANFIKAWTHQGRWQTNFHNRLGDDYGIEP